MSQELKPPVKEILLVEDNPGDVCLIEEAIADYSTPNRLHVVNDGAAALRFLRRQGIYSAAPRPDLVLLDLNLPRLDGREVLARMKADRDLRRIPVVVLTTSNDEDDVCRAYRLGANCYLRKPLQFSAFLNTMADVEHFWFVVATLPEEPKA